MTDRCKCSNSSTHGDPCCQDQPCDPGQSWSSEAESLLQQLDRIGAQAPPKVSIVPVHIAIAFACGSLSAFWFDTNVAYANLAWLILCVCWQLRGISREQLNMREYFDERLTRIQGDLARLIKQHRAECRQPADRNHDDGRSIEGPPPICRWCPDQRRLAEVPKTPEQNDNTETPARPLCFPPDCLR